MLAKIFLVLTIMIPLADLASDQKSNVIIQPNKLAIRGAMVDNYRTEIMAIKLNTPAMMVKRALDKIDLTNLPEDLQKKVLTTIGEIEKIANDKYFQLVNTIVDTLPLTTLIQEESDHLPKSFLHQSRAKRSPFRFFLSLLRLSRPVARMAPSLAKTGKYAKFIKGLKYTGYAASAAAISYEIIDAAGLIPDRRYEQLQLALNELYRNQNRDLEIMGNITLATQLFQEETVSCISHFQNIIMDSTTQIELFVKGMTMFNNYLDQLQLSLMLLINGKVSNFLLPLDTQRRWLENKLPTYLLTYIGSLTPTFDVKFGGYDYKEDAVFITLSLPEPGLQFQLLNFVEWEPQVRIGDKCYTSPEPFYYLAYPTTTSKEINVINEPYIFDSRSCLNQGFILCESDALLPRLPDIKFDEYCTKRITQEGNSNRKRREATPNLDKERQIPVLKYNLTTIIEESIKTRPQQMVIKARTEFDLLKKEIESEKERRKEEWGNLTRKLEEAERNHKIYQIIFITIMVISLLIAPGIILVQSYIIVKNKRNRDSAVLQRELRVLNDRQ